MAFVGLGTKTLLAQETTQEEYIRLQQQTQQLTTNLKDSQNKLADTQTHLKNNQINQQQIFEKLQSMRLVLKTLEEPVQQASISQISALDTSHISSLLVGLFRFQKQNPEEWSSSDKMP